MMSGVPESESSASIDATLSAVADEQRRSILRILEHTDRAMALDELVERVVERGRDESIGDHRQRVRTALHHIHIPKLEACGMVVRDPETGRIRNATDGMGRELLTIVESYE